MKNKSLKTKILVILSILIGLAVIGQIFQTRCSEPPDQPEINSVINIHYLYPRPGAKISFACHTWAFLKSPFAPRLIYYAEEVFKEDGYPILDGRYREGVIVARIAITDELYRQFPEPIKPGNPSPFLEAVSLYVDGKKLQIGHIGFRNLDREFNFTTILHPFLLPGEHVGKIIILLPSGRTLEYEWHFEITLW